MKVSTTAGSRKAASEGDPRSHYNCPMFAAGKLIFLIASITSGLRASASLVQQQNGTAWSSANSSTDAISPDVSECVLLFGAFCNGNLGDVIQASTMSRLVTKVASDSTCIWHAHPSKEKMANGFREGMCACVPRKLTVELWMALFASELFDPPRRSPLKSYLGSPPASPIELSCLRTSRIYIYYSG